MTRFVISRNLAVLLIHQLAALATKGNLVAGLIEVLHLNHLLVVARCNEGALIQEIRQIRAGKTGRIARHVFEVHFLRERDFLGVYLQDLVATVQIRQINRDLSVKTSGAQEGVIKDIGAVGCRDDDDPFVTVEAIHFNQQRIQGLLALVIPAAETRAALAAHCVDFIDKHNTGRVLAALFKHIAHARRADAHEHFNKIRSADRKERYVRLPCHRFRKQGLTGSRRAHHEHPFWNPAANRLKLFRVLQEINHLADFLLGFIATRHVFESHRILFARQHLGLALAKIHRPATGIAKLADKEKIQKPDDQQERQKTEKQILHRGAAALLL